MKETSIILVVDDEKSIRDGCRRVLIGKGYNVITAENGQHIIIDDAPDNLIEDNIFKKP